MRKQKRKYNNFLQSKKPQSSFITVANKADREEYLKISANVSQEIR